jgi:hypothetical protein
VADEGIYSLVDTRVYESDRSLRIFTTFVRMSFFNKMPWGGLTLCSSSFFKLP